ncbi:unnamed protein product [Effrenium voratum]|nr:unnamed protein product [Effrenium voratum]
MATCRSRSGSADTFRETNCTGALLLEGLDQWIAFNQTLDITGVSLENADLELWYNEDQDGDDWHKGSHYSPGFHRLTEGRRAARHVLLRWDTDQRGPEQLALVSLFGCERNETKANGSAGAKAALEQLALLRPLALAVAGCIICMVLRPRCRRGARGLPAAAEPEVELVPGDVMRGPFHRMPAPPELS